MLKEGGKIILYSNEAATLLRLQKARRISFTDLAKIKMTDFIEAAPRLLELMIPPAVEPVTLSEVKAYLRVDSADEDVTISNLIAAARQAAENYIRKSLITQTWKLEYNSEAYEQIFLPMGPVQSIASVKLTSRDGDESELDSSTYYLNAAKLYLVFEQVPAAHKITITYVAGYGSSALAVPMAIKQAILAYAAAMFDERDGTEMPEKAAALLAAYRSISV